MNVSELSLFSVSDIFFPFPHVVRDSLVLITLTLVVGTNTKEILGFVTFRFKPINQLGI